MLIELGSQLGVLLLGHWRLLIPGPQVWFGVQVGFGVGLGV
jgi:hypothetical protein